MVLGSKRCFFFFLYFESTGLLPTPVADPPLGAQCLWKQNCLASVLGYSAGSVPLLSCSRERRDALSSLRFVTEPVCNGR